MSSETALPRKNISYDYMKLYNSLGSLIKEYRKWRKISQEAFAEAIQISVRQLQNWESDRHPARTENLHDLSEFTGIPMQALVPLNGDQSVWYSLGKRFFAYSLMEKEQVASHEFFKRREEYDYNIFIDVSPISKDRLFNRILLCHNDIYGRKVPLTRDLIEAAVMILPDLNFILFDRSGHYVGHQVCLPLKMCVYNDLKKKCLFENHLTPQSLSKVLDPNEVVLFYYSMYFSSVRIAYRKVLVATRALDGLGNTDNYLIATHPASKESEQIVRNLGMQLVGTYGDNPSEPCPSIFESTWGDIKRSKGQLGWMLNPSHRHTTPDDPAGEEKPEMLQTVPAQEPDNAGQPAEKHSTRKKSRRDPLVNAGRVPSFAGRVPSVAGGKKQNDPNGKMQWIERENATCTNSKCTLYGKEGKGNIISNGTYRTKGGIPGRRFYCKQCGKSFCHRTGTIFYDLRSPEETVLKALKLLVKGTPLKRVAKSLGVKFHTVRHWLEVAAEQSDKIDAILIKEPDVSRMELDILWDFIKTNSLRKRAILLRSQNSPYEPEWRQ